MCNRISLNYERNTVDFSEPVWISRIFHRKSTRTAAEHGNVSLIFHRANRFYRGTPGLAQSDFLAAA